MKTIKKIFVISNVLLFIATLMSYMAPYINPTKAWIFPFFATAYFWLFICNLVFMIGWGLLKNKLWLLSFLAILLGLQHIGSYIGLAVNNSDPEDISIMSYNVGKKVDLRSNDAKTAYRKSFRSFLEKQSPSILCLQESWYTKFYRDSLGYSHCHRDGNMLILTDYEIKDKGAISFENSSNKISWADLQIKDKIVRVINMHLQSNMVSRQTEDLVNNPDLAERKTWVRMKSVITKIKRATSQRTAQAIEVRKFIDDSPHPIIVVGDFNDTPLSFTYRHLAKQLKDAFNEKGNGIGITYAGSVPGLRIDYILGDKDIRFKTYESPKIQLSDHYPVHSSFEF